VERKVEGEKKCEGKKVGRKWVFFFACLD